MFTDSQIKEIRHVQELISTLSRMQDKLYKQLIEEIGFSKYLEDKESFEYTGKEHINPEQYLFDLVYNESGEDFTKKLELIKRKIDEYSLA